MHGDNLEGMVFLGALPLILSIVCEFLQEIDHFICQAKERGYESLVSFGKKSINVAATAAIQVAAKVTSDVSFALISWRDWSGGKLGPCGAKGRGVLPLAYSFL